MIEKKEVAARGKKAVEPGNDWWNLLKPGLPGVQYTKLTNKLFKFARDFLLENGDRYKNIVKACRGLGW